MTHPRETSEGETGRWTQTDDGPVWTPAPYYASPAAEAAYRATVDAHARAVALWEAARCADWHPAKLDTVRAAAAECAHAGRVCAAAHAAAISR